MPTTFFARFAFFAAVTVAIVLVTWFGMVAMYQASMARSLRAVEGTILESTSRGWIVVVGPLTSDADLRPIAGVGKIEQLVLRGPITDAGLAIVAQNPQIRRLSLAGIGNPLVTDDAGAALSRITGLEEIDFRNTRLGDAFLAHLVDLPHLEQLDAGGSLVTDAGAKLLLKARRLQRATLPAAGVSEETRLELKAALRCEVVLTR